MGAGAPWTGPDQFETPDGKLMMLPSDMALIWDKEFRQHVQVYAKDEDKFKPAPLLDREAIVRILGVRQEWVEKGSTRLFRVRDRECAGKPCVTATETRWNSRSVPNRECLETRPRTRVRENRFFADFSSAFAKMLEFGCKFPEVDFRRPTTR